MLGAVAELERALIQERTKDGLRAAKTRGRVGGNPKLRAGDRDAIKQIIDAKSQAYFERVNRTAEHWLPVVKDMRPGHRWQDVARVLNAKRDRSSGPPLPLWSVERLKPAVKRFVAEGLADPALLHPPAANSAANGSRRSSPASRLASTMLSNAISASSAYRTRVHSPLRRGFTSVSNHSSIRRFLMHVLPKGFRRIRHLGFLANARRAHKLADIRAALNIAEPPPSVEPADYRERYAILTGQRIDICPCCGGRMVDLGPWPRPSAPPHSTPRCDTS